MELELEQIPLDGYETVLDTTVFCEETLEAIVPDACPDILRIWDSEGQACLSSREALDGRINLSGTVRVALLYLPDGEDGLRRMEVKIPFSCTADHPNLTPACRMVVLPRVQGAQVRVLNPRKVLIRVNLAVGVRAFAPYSEHLCAGVAADSSEGIEQLSESCTSYFTVCVQEKPFTYSDEVSLPGGKPDAAELLKYRVLLRCGEGKVIGSKLIFKGDACVQMFYRSMEGELCTGEVELPFSQIMEISGAGEEAGCEVDVILTDCDCMLDQGDGRTFSLTMELLAQAVVREARPLRMLTDVYSTSYALTTDTKTYTFDRLIDQGEREITARELLETGVMAREVSDAYASIGALSQSREGGRLTLNAQVEVTVLYLTEDGSRSTVTRSIQASCPLELPSDAVCTFLCTCTTPVFATATASGMEVRLPVRFRYIALSKRDTAAVSAIAMDENAPLDHSGQPSIVLRMVGAGERLWDIAKSYGTTARDITQANGLEEGTLPEGKLLLIPRKR